jgi:plastocyanin
VDLRRSIWAAAFLLLSGSCGGDAIDRASEQSPVAADETPVAKQATTSPAASKSKPRKVDPRRDGLEIVLGEWAVTPEVPAIRPGRVTFVIQNRGTMGHGYEVSLEGESSGHGSGDLFKAESSLLRPGETTRMTVALPPGLYKIECLVDGHDDMGMEGTLEVSPNAPLVKVAPKKSPDQVAVAGFGFSPGHLKVTAGTSVTWDNEDPTPHTITSTDGSFDSGTLESGASFAHKFTTPGVFAYRCEIHPEMKGKVTVQ